MITAPYNFVPLSDKVVNPFWAKHVSHDIPFEGAQSGVLKVKLKAESPIFVRNGVPKSQQESPAGKQFNNINDEYFIPGSSLKGMIRSVMEIMSFGRMGNKVNSHRYSVRDFQNNKIYDKTQISNHALCGWLYKKDGVFYLDDCGKPGRISHKNLDVLCGPTKISDYYKNAQNIKGDKDKSAKSKYDKFNFPKTGHKFSQDYESAGRTVYKIDDRGKEGTIVLTGQPGVRNEPEDGVPSGKHLEFVFFMAKEKNIVVPEEVIENFFFAYYDHDVNSQKEDWRWRKRQLDQGQKIPVFFRRDSNGQIKDLGLTLLFKITYEHSVLDLINNRQKDADSFDMAEAIFGYTEDKKALKGRVHFGHAFLSSEANPLDEKMEVLAGPKASYYPNYIEQKTGANVDGKITGDYQTYMDANASVRGWKRYPVWQRGGKSYDLPKRGDGSINYDVATKFIPLDKGAEFTFDIHYHNLRKEELGALISSLTFHNTFGLYHSLGSAKPLGYGKVTLAIDKESLDEEKKIEMLKSFEAFMDYSLKNSTPLWFQCIELKELFAMSKPGNDDNRLKYMKLTDFVNAKGRGKNDPHFALNRYSLISQNRVDVKSLISPEELAKIKKQYQEEEKLFAQTTDLNELKELKLETSRQNGNNILLEFKTQLKGKLEEKKDEILQNEERERLAQEKEEERKRREKKIEVARSGLPDEWPAINNFKNLSNRISKWIKLQEGQRVPNHLASELSDLLHPVIEFEMSNNKTKRDWKGTFELNRNWRKISEWLGEDLAKGLYNKLTSQ